MPAIRCDRCKLIWNANLATGSSCADCGRMFCPECADLEGLEERIVCLACRGKRVHRAAVAVGFGAVLAVLAFLLAWGWAECLDHAPMMMGR